MSHIYLGQPIFMTGTGCVEDLMRRINGLKTATQEFLLSYSVAIGGAYSTPFGPWYYNNYIYLTDGFANLGHKRIAATGASDSTFNNSFNYPRGAFGNASYFYVPDSWNFKVKKFQTSDNAYVSEWGSSGTGDGQFAYMDKVVVDSSGNVYVLDSYFPRIQKFNAAGGFLLKWGSFGSGDGQMNDAHGMGINSSDEIIVADYGNNRIQVFSSSGVFQRKWTCPAPTDACADSSGNVFAIDATNKIIRKFNSTGSQLLSFNISAPAASVYSYCLCIDTSQNIYVTEGVAATRKLQKYSFSTMPATTFYAYRASSNTKESIGTSPADGALAASFSGGGAELCLNLITDMRDAIEEIVAAGYYKNPATHNAYNWTGASADNLYYVAMGDRTKYGATGGAAYDWTAIAAGDPVYSIHIGEILECVTTLESAET